MRLGILGLWVYLLCGNTLMGQSSLKERIGVAMEQFLADQKVKYATTSLSVLDAQTGAEIYQYNGEVGLAPASTLKVVTAASAYSILGRDYTYTTELLYDGEISRDTLYGNLIIKGAGDPSLGSWRFKETKTDVIFSRWIEALKSKGVQYIRGKIIGDADVFDTQSVPGGWTWEDMGNYYGAGASGLTWHENQYDLVMTPGRTKGDPVPIKWTEPAMENLYFVNELKTGSPTSGDQVYIYAAPYGNTAFVRGTAPANHPDFTVSGSIPDPAMAFVLAFEKALLKKEIQTQEGGTTTRLLRAGGTTLLYDQPKILSVHHSPRLEQLSHWFLKKSINLYGEHFLKTIALLSGKTADTHHGLEKELDLWENRGIDKEAMHIMDGSGLSPGNRITTRALATVLLQARKEAWFGSFLENLPVIHNIRMKSGHIGGVAAYSGYTKDAAGNPLVFSFIVNNYSGSLNTLTPSIFKLLDSLGD